MLVCVHFPIQSMPNIPSKRLAGSSAGPEGRLLSAVEATTDAIAAAMGPAGGRRLAAPVDATTKIPGRGRTFGCRHEFHLRGQMPADRLALAAPARLKNIELNWGGLERRISIEFVSLEYLASRVARCTSGNDTMTFLVIQFPYSLVTKSATIAGRTVLTLNLASVVEEAFAVAAGWEIFFYDMITSGGKLTGKGRACSRRASPGWPRRSDLSCTPRSGSPRCCVRIAARQITFSYN